MKSVLAVLVALVAGLAAQEPRLREEKNEARLARLTEECSHRKRWKVEELEHYFLVTDIDDRSVLGELEKRVESVRKQIGLVFDPPQGSGSPGPQVTNPHAPPNKTVLRMHATSESYYASGGLHGTNGMYYPESTEIVVHSAKQQEGRVELFRMAHSLVVAEQLNRQFAPGAHAPWFEHGLQDYFAGFGFRNGKLERKPHALRLAEVRLALAADQFAPLADLVRMNRGEYYGENPFALDAKITWAQGWSLMWFLLHGESKNVSGADVIARYLAKWKEKPDAAAATAAAFDGVDWDLVEPEWRAYIAALKG